MRLLTLLALLLLTACAYSVDGEQARVCRLVLPAVNDEGARLDMLRVAPGPERGTVRIDYQVERIDRAPLIRHVVCAFPAEGLGQRKSELVGLATERGPVSGASLYLLKRHYLNTPDALAGDPDPGAPAGLVEVPRPAAYALQQALAALPRIAIYGLLAAAYALVFGLSGRINLAFGELAAVGAAASVSGVALMLVGGVEAPLAGLGLGLALALFAAALHGAAGGWAAIGLVQGRGGQATLIATVGLSIALMEYLRLAQSPVTIWIPPVWSQTLPLARAGEFVVTLTPRALLVAGIGLTSALLVLRLMKASRFGRSWRAYADDPRAAALFGIDGDRLFLQTLALSGALAGAAGFLNVAYYGGLGFAGGFQLGLKALIAAILGGIGSIPGAFLGGVAIAAFETAWSAALPIEARDIALYAALSLILVVRPGGFFGDRDRTPRPV